MSALSSRKVVRRLAETVLPSSLLIVRGPARRRTVALTFDDGPGELTHDYLRVLDRFSAKATFFVVGSECAKYPHLVADIASRGHELGVHGYTHRRFTTLSSSAIVKDELLPTVAFLPKSSNGKRWVRPPHGDVTPRVLLACARAGYTTVLWSLDSGDWSTRDPERVVAAVAPQSISAGAIVLLHEGQSWTLEALDEVIERLMESGHELVTLERLFDGHAN